MSRALRLPVVLWLATIAGVTLALLRDGLWDLLALTLAITPLAAMVWATLKTTKRAR